MDFTESLQRAARAVRVTTILVALAAGSGVVALQQFERTWGVESLGDGATAHVTVLNVERVDAP